MVARDIGYDYRCLWGGRSNSNIRPCRRPSGYDCSRSGANHSPGCRAYYGSGGSSHDRSSGGATNPDNPCSRRSARF